MYEYYYAGDKLMRMTMDQNGTHRCLDFYYDASGPYAVKVTNATATTTYYYVKNLQGDIVAIVNRSGKVLVTYTYDPWGNVLSIGGEYKNGLGVRNPLRYRGYVYDSETQFYYLQSRYYDPELGRFINADSYASTGQGVLGNNMFTYCQDNPVSGYDPTGDVPRNVIFPVCYDRGGTPITKFSDGKNGSDALLEYVCDNYIPYTNSTVYVDVTYEGIYTQDTSSNVSDWVNILGGITLISMAPGVNEIAWLSTALTWAGRASSAYGVVGLFSPETLPDKDYYQYKVTMSWVETSIDSSFPNVIVKTYYDVEMWFLWDDTSYTSPTWFLQSRSWNESRTEIYAR